MKYLKGSRCYLCGAMDRAPEQGKGWREMVTPVLDKFGVVVYNPCNKPIEYDPEIEQVSYRKQLKAEGRHDELASKMHEIRSIDLRMCDVCDFITVYLTNKIPTCGSWEEIFLANRQKKPILLVYEEGINEIPDWMFGTLPIEHLFNSFEEWEEYLHLVNRTGYDLTGRWKLFQIGDK